MVGYKVVRTIPPHLLQGINTGVYTAHGGVIRHAPGSPLGGRIVAHLQYGNPEALAQLVKTIPPLQPLLGATIALGALNLAVSVVGFTIVCSKLNGIRKQLDEVSAKIDKLLEGQEHAAWLSEVERRTTWAANMENLAIGLRTKNHQLSSVAIARLNESEQFYRFLSHHLLTNGRASYNDPSSVGTCLDMASSTCLARAHALSLQGHPKEAIRVVENLGEWQVKSRHLLELPLEEKPPWLARLTPEQRAGCKELVTRQREIPEGIEYIKYKYEFCIEYKVTEDDLAQLTQREPFAVLVLNGK